ncbi:MAG: AIPR family protein [Fimbriimonadaceae bacterium]|nr:AIPR family protein [Fimbriimonadaceae bacterium]
MDLTLEQFFEDYRQEYLANAEARGDFQLAEFTMHVAEDIRENGDLEGFEFCHWDSGRGARVDGYWFDDEGTLSLFVADFEFRDGVETLTQTEVTSALKRSSNFFLACVDKGLYRELEETSAEYGLARQIADRAESIQKVNIFLVSERRLSDRVKSLDEKVLAGRPVSYQVWDIDRLYRQRLASGQREPLEIDFVEIFDRGLPCLKAPLASNEYMSYLTVIPGRMLADLYEQFGARLLESNVRAFLQNRGAINKGIRSTILKEPSMFFAFNNGITATASNVEVEATDKGLTIRRITDLQIVNGGQTTASLFHTRRSDKASLSEVFVQMKLSVVDQLLGERIVPRIAEYANTQNKVSAADLFSNSPFHIRMEELSRRMFTPAVMGSIRGTKWFYERSRGQYQDELAKRTPGEQKKFSAEFPKNQMFTKTDLAKFENTWEDHPRWVNLGAQKNFVRYADRIATEWEKDPESFNEFYFRRVIARALVFRAAEKLVSAQPWYDGGYRANIVAYSIALIAEIARIRRCVVDLGLTWTTQKTGAALLDALKVTASFANDELRNPAIGISNVTEWAKRPACWDRMKLRVPTLEGNLPSEFYSLLIPPEQERIEKKAAKKEQIVIDGVAAVSQVMEVSAGTWRQIRSHLANQRVLTDKEASILGVVTKEPQGIPSDKQALILVELLRRGENEGIRIVRNRQ